MTTTTREREQFIARVAKEGGTYDQARAILRAARTLHRLAEESCGDGNAYQSWAREECEACGGSHMRIHPHQGPSYFRHGERCERDSTRFAEKRATERITKIASEIGARVRFQGDPRGCVASIFFASWVAMHGEPREFIDQGEGVPS